MSQWVTYVVVFVVWMLIAFLVVGLLAPLVRVEVLLIMLVCAALAILNIRVLSRRPRGR